MMPQILNNTMGSAAASLTFSQNTPMSQYGGQQDLSENVKVGTLHQSCFVVPRPFTVPGPKPSQALPQFTNEYLKPLTQESPGNEDRLVESMLEIYWKVDADEII